VGDLVFTHVGFGDRAVPYLDGWELQRRLHARRVDDEIPDTVLLLEHEPVYTAGKRTAAVDRPLTDPGAPVIDVDRGGKITWHGPGQLVGYPIMKLGEPVDVVAYVRLIEEALINACADVGVPCGRVEGRSGVWVSGPPPRLGATTPQGTGASAGMPSGATSGTPGGPPSRLDGRGGPDGPGGAPMIDRKVGAIGIRVSRGVTMHGFALNCEPDLSWYDRIVPCGIRDAGVTSLSVEIGRRVPVAEMVARSEHRLAEALGVDASYHRTLSLVLGDTAPDPLGDTAPDPRAGGETAAERLTGAHRAARVAEADDAVAARVP
jgi:lipoyl(octanoyl) transferase